MQRAWTILLLATLTSSTARAGILDTVGAGDSMAAGTTGAARSSAYSAFYNPAALRTRKVTLDLSLVYASNDFDVSTYHVHQQAVIPDAFGVSLGYVQNLYFIGLPRANVGLSAHVPLPDLFYWQTTLPTKKVERVNPATGKTETVSAANPRVFRFHDDLKHLEAHVGFSYWLFEGRLGLGFSLTLTAEVVVTSEVAMQPEDPDDPDGQAVKAQSADIAPVVVPGAGLLWDGGSFRVGLRYVAEHYIDDYGYNWVKDEALLHKTFGYAHHFAHYYRPHTLVAAGSWDPLAGLSLDLEVQWGHWSDFVDQYNHTRSGAFHDAVSVRLGGRYHLGRLGLSAGYGYEQSPLGEVPENTALVDTDNHVITAGVSYRFAYNRGGKRRPCRHLTLAASISARLIPLRRLERAGDGQPFEIAGGILAGGLGARAEF